MMRLFGDFSEAIARTVQIANACHFSLGEIEYEYPDEPVPPNKTPQQHLEDLTWEGAHKCYLNGIPPDVEKRLREELAIIARLDYARYFVTGHDVVAISRQQEILCQGRGSPAKSAGCYFRDI